MAFLAGIMLTRSWEVLAPVTLVVVGLTLLALGQKPWLDEGAIVGLGDFSVHIAPVCSGVEGMGLLGAFLLGFLAIFHRDLRLRRALFLVPAALLASFLLNALRIALLLMIGAFGHPDVAVAGFHTKAGWIFFSFLALVFVAIMKSPPFQRDPVWSRSIRR
jgi:exosortase E/protease (VPEID-CTERM system)